MTILPESFRGLRTRLVLWFVALSLVPLAIVGVLAFRRSSADLSIKAGEFLQTQAEATIDKIDRNLFERYGDVQAFTFHPKARGGRADVEEIANVYTKAYGIYDLMLVVDADGLVKGCNSRDRDGAPIDSSRFVGRSVRDEDWFQAIQSGRIAAGQSWFADPTVDPWVGELGLTGLTLNFAAPIFDEQGHFAGAWSNRASFDRIVGEIMQETRASLHKQGFGTIASQVLTRDGLVLDDADPAAVLKTNLARSGSDAARRGTQGENGFSAQADVRTGRELVSGFASSKGALGFPGYGWTVLVSQDLDDALASVHRLRTFLGWLVLGAAVVIVAAASRVARDIARPISRTAEVLDALAAGNLEQQLETASRDEIGRMGAALNRTTQVLRSLMEETSRLTQAARDGRLAERADALRFEGGYRELCEGVNGMLDAVLEPVRESTLVMQRLAAGDLSQAVRGDYAGDHRVLTDSLNATIEVLRGVLEELNRLVAAADAGSLSERADAERFAGAYAELCARVNRMLDGILAPIGEAREVLAAVAQGDLTRAVRGEYRGDHERVKTSLNETLAVLRRLMEDTSSLIRACERGELSARAPAERYQGSYRELCTQINTMLDAVVEPIHESTRVLERVAEGDLSARIVGDYAGQHAAIKVAVNAAVEGMRGALVSISTSAGELSRSSTDLDGVSTRIGDDARRAATQIQAAAGSAGEVDSNVQSVASATEEMTASIDEIALRSSEASRSASSAVETVREAHACVTRLGASSAEIESVVKLITAIAEQTNLLALNATIEAARAGESGRGFAVVANEVKELANQTSTATAEIATKIAGIQGDTRAAVEAMARIQEVIAAIHALQTSIAGAVEEQSATTKEITRSVSDVARGTSSIVQSLDGVAQIADQTSRGAQQAGAGAQSASRMAQELHALVAQFRCDAPVADGAQSPKSTRAPRPLAATVAR